MHYSGVEEVCVGGEEHLVFGVGVDGVGHGGEYICANGKIRTYCLGTAVPVRVSGSRSGLAFSGSLADTYFLGERHWQ